MHGKKGKAIISCEVSVQGTLLDCLVISETPEGSGFGGAALALSPQLLMKPATRNGTPIPGGQVRIPVNFDWPAGYRSPGMLTKPVATNVVWEAAPTYAQVVAAYPAKARAAGVGGNATLGCTFKTEGRLTSCSVLGQTPAGMGFGEAARSLAQFFIGPALRTDGESSKGVAVQIPVTFALEMLTSSKPVTGKPKWTATPSADDLVGAIPAAAVAAGVKTARVVIACAIAQGGGIEACAITKEDPPGLGFGEATLRLAKSIRVSTWTVEGLPTVGGSVTVPIRYDVPQPEAAPTKPTSKP